MSFPARTTNVTALRTRFSVPYSCVRVVCRPLDACTEYPFCVTVRLSIPAVHLVERKRPALHCERDIDYVEYRHMSFTPLTPVLPQFNER